MLRWQGSVYTGYDACHVGAGLTTSRRLTARIRMPGIDQVPAVLDFLKAHLEEGWDQSLAHLWASGTPLNLEGDDPAKDDDKKDDDPAKVDDKKVDDKKADDKKDDTDDLDDDDDDGEEYVRVKKSEYEEQQRAARQQSARAKKAEQDAKAEREKKAAEEGRYRELSDGYKAERDAAVTEAATARQELVDTRRRIEVEKVAKRLDFVDTEDAWIHISRANLADETWDDSVQVEKALKRILRDKPHLQGKARPTGASRKGGGTTLSHEEIERMSESEINRRWDEVQAALSTNG